MSPGDGQTSEREAWTKGLGRVAAYGTAVVPLLLLPGLFYPYTTLRGGAFRVLAAAVLAAAMWVVAREPKKQRRVQDMPLFWTFVGLVGAGFLAVLFSPSVPRSLLGSLERLEGWVTWLSWAGFGVGLLVLCRPVDWRRLFRTVAVVGLVVAAVAAVQWWTGTRFGNPELFEYSQRRGPVTSVLGNPGYLGGYGLMLAAVGVWLWGEDRGRWRSLGGAAVLAGLACVGMAESRAAMLGGGVAVGLWTGWALMRRVSTRARWIVGFGLIGTAAVVVVAMGLTPLQRFLSGLPVGLPTGAVTQGLEMRLAAWSAGWEAFLDQPILGWGVDNFYLAFERHVPATVFEATGGDSFPNFDQAHNAFIGVFVEAGLLGGLAFLGIIGAAAVAAARTVGQTEGLARARMAVATLGAGYLVYLSFWFPDLSSFPVFFAVAAWFAQKAWRERQTGGEEVPGGEGSGAASRDGSLPSWAGPAVVGGVALLVGGYQFQVLQTSRQLIEARTTQNLEPRTERYVAAVSGRPPGTQEVLLDMVDFLAQLRPEVERIQKHPSVAETVQTGIQTALAQMAEEVERDTRNPRVWAMRASILETAHSFSGQQKALKQAARALEQAVQFSPKRLTYRHVLARVYLKLGQPKPAIATLREGIEIYPRSGTIHLWLAEAERIAGRPVEAYRSLRRAMELGGVSKERARGVAAELADVLRETAGSDEAVRWLSETFGLSRKPAS